MEASTGWDIRSVFVYGPLGLIVPLVAFFVVLVPVGQVLRRTGHHPAWSLLVLFPGVNLIAAWFFAFKASPIQGASKAGSEVG
jgi:hypothetical protein